MRDLKIFFSLAALAVLVAAFTLVPNDANKSLTIDGSAAAYKDSSIIHIPAAKYSNITIKNFNRSALIVNIGLVEITGNGSGMSLSNVHNITVSGNGTPGITQGFSFHDNTGRALQFSGAVHNVTIQYALFKNIGDYVISNDFGSTVYKSTDSTSYWSGVHFLNLEFSNTGQINLDGDITKSSIVGVIKNFEMAYCYLHDMSPGDLVFAGAVDRYNIHHNIVNNVNTTNNNDNGIWHLQGVGTFAYNKVTNHQGHAIRAWVVSLGASVSNELIYNNIVANSRKYSAFEVQGFQALLIAGKTTFANARVFGNTCGNLDLSKDWNGVVVDVYGLYGGTCSVFDNIGYNFPAPNPTSNIVSQQYNTVPSESNNLYFANATLAGIDTTTFNLKSTSAAIGKGIADAALADDYYGNKRNTPPSIGAVEYGSTTTYIPPPPPPPIIITTPAIDSVLSIYTITIHKSGTVDIKKQ